MIRLKKLLTEDTFPLKSDEVEAVRNYVDAMIYILDFIIEIFRNKDINPLNLSADEWDRKARSRIQRAEEKKKIISDYAEKFYKDQTWDNLWPLDTYIEFEVWDSIDDLGYQIDDKDRKLINKLKYDIILDRLVSPFPRGSNEKPKSPKKVNKSIDLMYAELTKWLDKHKKLYPFQGKKPIGPSDAPPYWNNRSKPDIDADRIIKSDGYKIAEKIDLPDGKYPVLYDDHVAKIYNQFTSSDGEEKFKNTGYAFSTTHTNRGPQTFGSYKNIVNGVVKDDFIPFKIYFNPSAPQIEPEIKPPYYFRLRFNSYQLPQNKNIKK